MKKPATFFVLFLLFTAGLSAQFKSDSTARKFAISVRGKVAAFFIIEDLFFRTATLGAEFIYKDRHSLGIDASFFRWRREYDNSKDSALYEDIERRRYLLIDYKLRIITFKKQKLKLYFNLYGKTGSYHAWGYEPGKTVSYEKSTNWHKAIGTFREAGTGFGLKKHFNHERFGIDVSANYAFRQNIVTYIDYFSPTQYVKTIDALQQKPLFYMRVNFFCILGKGPFF